MDAIVSHIWQSTIFAAAAGMLALMFRNNGASVRYWIWFAAAAKFLVPLAALAAIANLIPMPQASDAATEALDAATLVFRTSVFPVHPDLDQAALDAAAQWVFEPGTRNGKPVNVLVTIAMAFTLKKHSGEM